MSDRFQDDPSEVVIGEVDNADKVRKLVDRIRPAFVKRHRTVDSSKQSKQAVEYSLGMPSSHCGICRHFEKPHSCELVDGVISPAYWCKLFDKATHDAGFHEEQHPRDKGGEFTKKGSGSTAAPKQSASGGHLRSTVVNGERRAANGEALPEHIGKLKLPPAWTDVTYNPDPHGKLMATGKDAKGRAQYVYSAAFAQSQAEAKFRRIQELDKKMAQIKAQNDKARQSSDPKVRAHADAAHLLMQTGIRPGSDSDTKAKVKAYGATTLEGRHVVHGAGGTRLQFTGKKGVNLDLPVDDAETAKMLRSRAKSAGTNGKLFEGVTDKSLLDYVHGFDGGGFKSKDLRTHLGTKTALDEIAQRDVPRTAKDYKKAVLEVAKKVAAKLGNTPTVALQSYINPTVFSGWKAAHEQSA